MTIERISIAQSILVQAPKRLKKRPELASFTEKKFLARFRLYLKTNDFRRFRLVDLAILIKYFFDRDMETASNAILKRTALNDLRLFVLHQTRHDHHALLHKHLVDVDMAHMERAIAKMTWRHTEKHGMLRLSDGEILSDIDRLGDAVLKYFANEPIYRAQELLDIEQIFAHGLLGHMDDLDSVQRFNATEHRFFLNLLHRLCSFKDSLFRAEKPVVIISSTAMALWLQAQFPIGSDQDIYAEFFVADFANVGLPETVRVIKTGLSGCEGEDTIFSYVDTALNKMIPRYRQVNYLSFRNPFRGQKSYHMGLLNKKERIRTIYPHDFLKEMEKPSLLKKI